MKQALIGILCAAFTYNAYADDVPEEAPAPETPAVEAAAPVSSEPVIGTIHYDCKRYRSKCSANACLEIAPKLAKDTARQILSVVTPESITYAIDKQRAQETLYNLATPNPDSTYVPPKQTKAVYEYVTPLPNQIRLENKTPNGQVKEEVEINTDSGFYAYYVLHTDGSITDIPVGTPYFAYFGWCDKMAEPAPPAPAPVNP